MHPPAHIVAKLQELHPQARLGWVGKDKRDPDELNAGNFALLQLYHQRDASRTYLEAWGDRGPVFGKDYDRLSRVPVWVKNFTKQEVFSGAILDDVKKMLRPVRERYEVSALQKGSQQASAMRDLAGEAGQFLWHTSQKRDNAVPQTKKFNPFTEPTRSADDLKTAFMPKPIEAEPLR